MVVVGFGVLYKELRDNRKQVTDLADKISKQGERLARIEGRLGKE